MIPQADRESFFRRYEPDLNTGCWIWNGYTNWNGYGVLRFGDHKSFKAHRASYIMNVGSIPDGLVIMHKCDTPSCVNPDHLEVGTQKKNLEDMRKRGRASGGSMPGESHHQSKLKEADVISIIEMAKAGKKVREIAPQFPVSKSHIWRILRGANWRKMVREAVDARKVELGG